MDSSLTLITILLLLAGNGWLVSLFLLTRQWRHVRFHRRLPLRLAGSQMFALILVWLGMQILGSGALRFLRQAGPFEIIASDVQWAELQQTLTAAARSPKKKPAARIWELLSNRARQEVLQAEDLSSNPQAQAVLLEELHQILLYPNFYQQDYFKDVDFRYRDLFADELLLNDRQLTRLNRLLLEASMPSVFAKSMRLLLLALAVLNTATLVVLLFVAVIGLGVPIRQLGLSPVGVPLRLAYGVTQAMFWGPLALLCSAVMRALMPPESIHEAQNFFAVQQTPFDWLLLITCVSVLAPLMEELLFRGLIQGWLSRRVGAWGAIFASALLFGFAHSTWPDPIALTLLGIGLGLTYQKTRSLYSCIAFHAVFNAFGIAAGAAGG